MKCDGCTLCCKLLDIYWMDSPKGEYCKECEPEVGCEIWENVPEDCKKYKCAYNQAEGIDIKYRPDNCGVIFEKATDTIFYGTIDDNVMVLGDTANEQIGIFLKKGFSVVLRYLGTPTPLVFNTEDRTAEDVWKEIKEAAWQHQATLQTYKT